MQLLQHSTQTPITLHLSRDLTRALKRGHPWVFADSLRALPPAMSGSPARLFDKRGREVAVGFYDPYSPLAFRACHTETGQPLDDAWAARQMARALTLRQTLFDSRTTGYRLFNGEGDGLPGMVCDIYHQTAVLRFDGPTPVQFWHAAGIAEWLVERLSLGTVYLRERSRGGPAGLTLIGSDPEGPVEFLEQGVRFTADVVSGQKTGFFLDQRENRARIRQVAAGKRVLNVFGYTGGFSVYAGLGGASHVTTVDLARPALEMAEAHWQLNGLPAAQHVTVAADAFEFLNRAARQGDDWELVVLDPPSFAPSQKSASKALTAYKNLIAAGAAVTTSAGLLAAASCSSHVSQREFLSACEEGISKARRRATVLSITGQPPDHPTPLVAPELRYLKFVLMQVV